MPWYKAGTATVTKGSPDVVGVGTTWGNGALHFQLALGQQVQKHG